MTAALRREPALEARRIGARLGQAEVLHGIDLALAERRWTSIVGPNGAGKSTLLRVLAGLLRHSGDVRLFGQALSATTGRARARRLSWLGQGGAGEGSADDLMVWDVAMLGRLPHQRWLAAPSDADRAAVERALRRTQAWEWRDRPLGELSGGERQRVLLARALAVEAEVLLMDEPLANLDPPHQADWMQTVRELIAQGRTVISVLHELNAALAADDMVVMAGGRVLHHGPCEDPATHRALEAVFDRRVAVHRVEGHWLAVPR
ncbi:iron complex transport system ATP-binding protein [Variovorax sp. HW608]|uniref:ABC transporter ATP-binding protein n=1 Tax=Variovorax sp. HW608 TaxID=1034889 RepID=UPI0008200D0E|nr:ABC transporter ATP-binding protein [Variovorax sp. HW608]SCK53317.1 iron complex transport system ATP-binding protein [Variovorax sp. HW608]